MMNVSRFWLSTFFKKPNGTASIDCRTLSSVGGVLAERLFQQVPWPRRGRRRWRWPAPGLMLAKSLMTASCSSPVTLVSLAISIETASTSLVRQLAEDFCGLLLRKAHQQHGGFAERTHRFGARIGLRRGVRAVSAHTRVIGQRVAAA